MSVWFASTFERLLNPMMVKDLYQGFRGRLFMLGTSLALLASLIAYATLVLAANEREPGEELAVVLGAALAFVAVGIIPTNAGMQLRSEIDNRTHELIVVTGATPWAIASGRFLGATLRLLLVFSCMVPFLATALLLGGIGPMMLAAVIIIPMTASLLVTSFMLMFNALPSWRFIAVTAHRVQFILPMFAFLVTTALLGATLDGVFSPDWALLWALICCLAATFFFLRLTADLLTPQGTRTYAWSKLSLLVMPAVFMAGDFLNTGNHLDELAIVSLPPAFLFAIFYSGSQLDPRAAGRRRIFFLLGEGYWRTVLYALIVVAAITLVGGQEDSDILEGGAVAFMYFLFATGSARLISSLFDPGGRRVWVYYTVLLIFCVLNVGLSIPYLVAVDSHAIPAVSTISGFFPFTFESQRRFDVSWENVVLPACLGLLGAGLATQRWLRARRG